MNSLLPPGSSPLERRLAQTCSGISDLQVPLRDLWNPATCPVSFLPYLAWAFSVDRWDESWAENVKRRCFLHPSAQGDNQRRAARGGAVRLPDPHH